MLGHIISRVLTAFHRSCSAGKRSTTPLCASLFQLMKEVSCAAARAVARCLVLRSCAAGVLPAMLALWGALARPAAATNVATASTRPAPSGVVRIALLADTHTTRGTAEDQARYKGRFDKVIADVNAAVVDLVLIAGDLTQDGRDEQWRDFQAQARGFKAPFLIVPGNHDVGDKRTADKPGSVTAQRVASYEAALGHSFWVDQRPGVRVVGLNSSLLGSGLAREVDQWAFLDKVLARPAGVPTVVLLHHPPFVEAADEKGGTYWNIEPAPRARLLALLQSGHVCAVFSGHLHRPLFNQYAGVSFLTAPPVSFGLPRGLQPQGWTFITLARDGSLHSEYRWIAD